MTSFNFLLGVVKTFKNRLLTVSMKQRRPLHRFSLFIGLLSLLISVVALTPPTALAISGKIQEFPIPTATSDTFGITAGPDGNLWFTEFNGNNVGRITTAGVITEFALSAGNNEPVGITKGPDGNLWFTEFFGVGKIGRITTAGVVINEFPIP